MWLINVGVPNGAFNLQSSEKIVPSLPFSPKTDLGKCSLPLESANNVLCKLSDANSISFFPYCLCSQFPSELVDNSKIMLHCF